MMTFLRSKCGAVVIVIGIFILVITYLVLARRNQSSPYSDIIFIEDRPGANGRYVSFTPVLRDDLTVVVGPSIGADYGRLFFKDIDGDGGKETIVESQLPLVDFGEFYTHRREVLRYIVESDGTARMEAVVESR